MKIEYFGCDATREAGADTELMPHNPKQLDKGHIIHVSGSTQNILLGKVKENWIFLDALQIGKP